jgi:hypothetical protein
VSTLDLVNFEDKPCQRLVTFVDPDLSTTSRDLDRLFDAVDRPGSGSMFCSVVLPRIVETGLPQDGSCVFGIGAKIAVVMAKTINRLLKEVFRLGKFRRSSVRDSFVVFVKEQQQ